MEDFEIKDSYVMTKEGVILWLCIQRHITEVFRIAPKSASSDSRAIMYVPQITKKEDTLAQIDDELKKFLTPKL